MTKMNKIMRNFYNTADKAAVIEMLRNSGPSLTPLHEACTRALNREHDYYMGNRLYNRYVVNGDHKPENLGEEVNLQVSLVPMNEDIKRAYLMACWIWNSGEFQFLYPSKEEVVLMLMRLQ